MGFILFATIFWILPIIVAMQIGKRKDRAGFAYGFFLGWIGVIIIACLGPRLGDKLQECPWCREPMKANAMVCPHCHRSHPVTGAIS